MEIPSNRGENEADRDGVVELPLKSVCGAAFMAEGKLGYTWKSPGLD